MVAQRRPEGRNQKEERRAVAGWQHDWSVAEKGSWTRRLIGDIASWLDRGHGEVDFYLTQFLVGHGCFNDYLHGIGKSDTSGCRYCNWEWDDTEHAVLRCDR